MQSLHAYVLRELRNKGVRIDAVYFCPHNPDRGCDCRKPAPGMALAAVADFDVSLNDSWMVGDRDVDVLMGRECNMKTIKLGGKISPEHKVEPRHYARDLKETVDIIIKNENIKVQN